jgi:hypothetical protein
MESSDSYGAATYGGAYYNPDTKRYEKSRGSSSYAGVHSLTSNQTLAAMHGAKYSGGTLPG